MRLSDVLSKGTSHKDFQVEGFLGAARIRPGRHKLVRAGKVASNYYCVTCEDIRTFMSSDELSCLVTGEREASLDIVLTCPACESSFEAWFLISSREALCSQAPHVRVERRVENRRGRVKRFGDAEGNFSDLLDKAETAHSLGLGSGSIIYLRQILESVTKEVASVAGVPITSDNGKRKPFRRLLQEVDSCQPLIPARFATNGYRLFGELSEVSHGGSTEEQALANYSPWRELVLGVVRNVLLDRDIASAMNALGWDATIISEVLTGEGLS